MHDTLAEANAPHPEEEEYYYDSDDSVINLDMECLEMSQHVVKWVTVEQTMAPLPPWCPSDFGELEHVSYSHKPDLREVLNQNARHRMAANIPIQPVTPLTPPAPGGACVWVCERSRLAASQVVWPNNRQTTTFLAGGWTKEEG